MKVKHSTTNVEYEVVRKRTLGSPSLWVLRSLVDGSRIMVNWEQKKDEYTVIEQ